MQLNSQSENKYTSDLLSKSYQINDEALFLTTDQIGNLAITNLDVTQPESFDFGTFAVKSSI